MKKSNPGKILLIILIIASLGGAAFFLSEKIVSTLLAPGSVTERTVDEPDSEEETDDPRTGPSEESGKEISGSELTGQERLISEAQERGLQGLEHCYLAAKLENDMQDNFLALYESVAGFKDICDLPHLCSEEDAAVLVELLHSECPELFQFDNTESYYTTSLMGKVDTISVPYSMGMTEYLELRQQCETEIARILAAASEESTDYDRELAVYREYCRGTLYDLTTDHCSLSVGPLVEKRGKCDGISLGFKWIMNKLGIPCMVISGDNKEPGEIGHAWNMIMIDGKWYCLDVTAEWSDEERDSYLYPAFNISEDWEAQRFTVSRIYQELGVPGCDTMEGSFHVKNGSYVTAGEDARAAFEERMNRAMNDNGVCLIQFEDPADWQAFNDESAGWANSWLEENGYYGSTKTLTIPNYQVAEIRMEINRNSARMNELLPRIDALKADLRERSEQMESKRAYANSLVDRAREIDEELAQMQQEEPSGDTWYDYYNSLVEEYNAVVEEYRQVSEEYNQMLEQYNEDSNRLQSMISEYNSMVQQ